MSKDPKRLRIAGSYYPVHWKDAVYGDNGEACYGTTDQERQCIEMENSLVHDKRRMKLLHEAIHAIVDELRYDWPEETVQQAETAIFMLLRDNPSFVRWLMQRDHK